MRLESPRSPRRTKGVAIVVALAVLVAGASVAVYRWGQIGSGPSPSPSTNVGNGVTFNASFQAVGLSIDSLPGGPWSLVSVSGVASTVPLAAQPMVDYEANYSLNETAQVCGALPGVTAWNMTLLPTFTGAPDSGAAPFWSLVFKNGSGSTAFATDIEGSVRVYPPSPSVQECAKVTGLAEASPIDPGIDTSEVADAAFSGAKSSITRVVTPLVEYYVYGAPQQVDVDSAPVWILNIFRCDLAGVSGVQNYTAVGVNSTGAIFAIDAGFLTCTSPEGYSLLPEPSSNSTYGPNASSRSFEIPFQVSFPATPNGTRFYDGWGLQPWMFRVAAQNASHSSLPIATPTCVDWVESVQNCPATPDGWFAVLTTASGTWLDAYPSSPSNDSWVYPNALVVSNDCLVVVVPASWNTTGDTLGVTGVAANAPVGMTSPL